MTETERRKFLKASLASLAGAAGVSLPGCNREPCCYDVAIPESERDNTDAPESVKEETPSPEPEPTDAAAEKAAHREELTEQLKELAETDPGDEFEIISADCYKVAPIEWDK